MMRSPTELLRAAWALFAANIRLLVSIYLVPAILAIVYGSFVGLMSVQTIDPSLKLVSTPFMVLMTIILVVVSVIASIGLIRAVSAPHDTTIVSAYRFGLSNLWSYIWISILTGLAVMVGLMLFIVPGIIFMVWFAFGYYVLIFEGKKGVDAMKASKAYVRDRWFPVFLRLLVLFVVIIAISGIVSGILSAVLGSRELAGLVEGALNLIFVPFSVAYTYLLYSDLKKPRESNPFEHTASAESGDAA